MGIENKQYAKLYSCFLAVYLLFTAAFLLCGAIRQGSWLEANFIWLWLIIFAGCSTFFALSVQMHKHGKREYVISTIYAVKKYRFLLEQMVARDFKVRYKRSVLGMFWSFLNPLLTMAVQYMVFSQVFRNIDNFVLYLLSGTIVFNFFSEAVGQALEAIVGNASLIKKVYMPKYIYPVTKVLSSGINFLTSLIPLFLVAFLTGGKFTTAYLMLPFVMVCVVLFSIGWGMLMSALMVFFRDIQFLWSVFSMLWMYLTPLFYPENILAERYAWVLKMNPMYYYVKFFRSIVLDAAAPQPELFAQCLLFSVCSVIIGGIVFKKTQDRFVLNI